MLKIRDFRCVNSGESFTRWVKDDIKQVECKCGSIADRMLSAPTVVPNTTGRSPSFSNRKW